MKLDDALFSRLREHEVQVDSPDGNTLLLRGVPTSPRFFNKERTNLILARRRRNQPYLVCVDEDLEYHGEDTALTRAFAHGPTQAGWRAIFVPRDGRDVRRAVEQALAALGFETPEPSIATDLRPAGTDERGRLADLGTELGLDAAEADFEPTLGRETEANLVAAALLKWGQARLPVIVGEPGVGKTNLLQAVARMLRKREPGLRIVSVDVAALFAGQMFPSDREAALAGLLEEARAASDTVLALEQVELALGEIPLGGLLLAGSADAGLRMTGTALPASLPRLTAGLLGRRAQVVRLAESTPEETVGILRALRVRLSAHHGVDVEESCIRFCVSSAHDLRGHLPAGAIDLLDTACSLASLAGAEVVGPDDICRAAAGMRGLS